MSTTAYSKLEADNKFANQNNFNQLKETVNSLSVNGGKIFLTLADAEADLANISDNERVEVYADEDSKNGIYTKIDDELVYVGKNPASVINDVFTDGWVDTGAVQSTTNTPASNSSTINTIHGVSGSIGIVPNPFNKAFFAFAQKTETPVTQAEIRLFKGKTVGGELIAKKRVSFTAHATAQVVEEVTFDEVIDYDGEMWMQALVNNPMAYKRVTPAVQRTSALGYGVVMATTVNNLDGTTFATNAGYVDLGITFNTLENKLQLTEKGEQTIITDEIAEGNMLAAQSDAVAKEINPLKANFVRDEQFYYDATGADLVSIPTNRTIIRNQALTKNRNFKYVRVFVSQAGVLQVGIFEKPTSTTMKSLKYSAELTLNVGNQIIELPEEITANAGQYIGFYLKTARTFVDFNRNNELGGDRVYTAGKIEVDATETTAGTQNYDLFSLIETLTLDDKIEMSTENSGNQEIGTGTVLPINSNADNGSTVNPLFIADTFGLNQPLHPTVHYFAGGFNGFKYVMVQTPYPQSGNPLYKDRYECPTLHFSNDKINWTAGILMDDLTADEITARSYFSDPELVYNSDTNTLECWYRLTHVNARPGETNVGTRLLRKIINSNGTLSARQVLMTEAEMTTYASVVRSPALLYEGGVYKMWFTGYQTSSNVGYGYTATPENPSSWVFANVVMTGKTESTWHLDVVRSGTDLYLIDNTTPNNLVLYKSTGSEINFAFVKRLLDKTLNNKDYYGQAVYRATGLIVDGLFTLFVSGWNNIVASIGIMEGTSFESLINKDGGYVRQDLRVGGNIRLGNLEHMSSMIELDDRGNALGFDYASKTLYFLSDSGKKYKIITAE